MSLTDRIRQYKERYDEMDSYERSRIHIAVVLIILISISLFLVLRSMDTLENFLA